MSAEDRPSCDGFRDELTRLSCAAEAPSAALRAHLAECRTCRESLAADRELVDALRTALQPESLPPELAKQIRDEISEPRCVFVVGGIPRRALHHLLWWSAAAAAVLVAILLPRFLRQSTAPDGVVPSVTALSPDDAELAAQCWGLTAWDSPIKEAVQYVAESVDEVARVVTRDPAGERLLPWSADDDWDMPKDSGGSSGLRQWCG